MKGATLLIFLKAPLPGTVKTRLAVEYGEDFACGVYKSMAENIICSASGFNVTLCYYPEESRAIITDWLGQGHALMAQTGGDLGQRMENAFLYAFSGGDDKAVLVGTDIPGLDAQIFKKAYQALDENDCVIGPALDGGYYLIGFRKSRFCRAVFQNMEWSVGSVFEKTVKILEDRGVSISIIDSKNDIDTPEDYRNHMESKYGPFWKAADRV